MMDVHKIYAIVGYTYQADNYCPSCMDVIALAKLSTMNVPMPLVWFGNATERLLNLWADHLGIERENESTFDSDVFPKVVFASMVEHERCAKCGEELS